MKSLLLAAAATMLVAGAPAFADTDTSASVTLAPEAIAEARANTALEITDAQKAKLGALRDQFQLDTATKKAQLEVAQNQLRRVLSEPNIDKQAALSLQAKINGLRDDLSTARLQLKLAAADVFTPEQRAAFRQMHHWHHGFGGHHRGGCFGGGCGAHGHGGPAAGPATKAEVEQPADNS